MMVSFPAKSLGVFFMAASLVLTLGGCSMTPDAAPKTDGLLLSLHQTAQTKEAENNYQAAASHYQNLLHRQPDNLAFILGLARNLRYAGNAKGALETLEDGQKKFAGHPAFLLELGKAKLAAGNAQGAIETLKPLVGRRSGNWSVYASLGIAYDLLQSPDEAWQAYGQAIDMSPGNPEVLNNMALSAALGGKIELAISTLEGAGSQARKNPQMRQNLALFYAIKGDMKKAETIAKIDLDETSLRHNLEIYSRLNGRAAKQ